MSVVQTRQLTLRIPKELYQQIQDLAKKRRTSINQLAQTGLRNLARQELAERMRSAYEMLGADDESSVEPFLPAQAEVLQDEQE